MKVTGHKTVDGYVDYLYRGNANVMSDLLPDEKLKLIGLLMSEKIGPCEEIFEGPWKEELLRAVMCYFVNGDEASKDNLIYAIEDSGKHWYKNVIYKILDQRDVMQAGHCNEMLQGNGGNDEN